MQNKTTPFWEQSYKRIGKLDTFGGGKPSKEVVSIIPKLPKNANVLDLGCGEGRNALYLAGLGFTTSATDISTSGIEKLNQFALQNKLIINASVSDMRYFSFNQQYDLIVCLGCLHLIYRDEWKTMIEKIQQSTSVGGYNIVGVFNDEAPEPEDQKGLMVGLFKKEELFTYYENWEIKAKSSFDFVHTHPDGPTHRHAGDNLIAIKKGL